MIYILIPTTKERRPRLEKCINSIRESACDHPFTICVYENTDGGWAKAILKMIEGINGLVFLISDDMIVDKDCVRILYEKYMETFPTMDGLAQPWENYGGGLNADCPMIHTDILRPILEAGYYHYADSEIAQTMCDRKKHITVAEAKITHIHMNEFPELEDETYTKAHEHRQEDNELFISRMKPNYGNE